MALTTKPLGNSFVNEVLGLSLWADLDASTADALRALWSTSGVLVFRRQAGYGEEKPLAESIKRQTLDR